MKRYAAAKEMVVLSRRYSLDTLLMRNATQYYLQLFRDAPLGDKIDEWRNEIQQLAAVPGPRLAYFENRKSQVRYFVGLCPDESVSQTAMEDLKGELAAYQEQNSAAGSGSFPPHGQYLLTLTLKSGKEVRIPRESLPPPLNQGDIPPTFWECIAALSSEDEGLALDELWRHYQKVTVDWTTQAALLRETTALPLTPQTDLPINGQPQTKR